MSALKRRGGGQARELSHVTDEMHAGHVSDEGIIFRHVSDGAADLSSIAMGIESEDAGGALRRRMKSQQRVDQRRFSRAIWTEQADGVSQQLAGEPIEHRAMCRAVLPIRQAQLQDSSRPCHSLTFSASCLFPVRIKAPSFKKSNPKSWLSLAASIRVSFPQAHMVVGLGVSRQLLDR